ncbi:transcription factor-like 5 protein [Centropristis striata]|uniref:transcription factor-like 5 protein n=1 Tax=Centropristis striata TaxID=184440 RepID=UPI0027DFC8C1|nr:transcription factor-like 5 protein [Centropristis striata]
MSSFPSAHKTLHVSPSSRDHTCDPVGLILSQGRCLTHDHGQILGPEFGLMEMSEVEYTHLQHFIQAHMEANVTPPDARSHPAMGMVKDPTGSTVMSPLMVSQAIDLSVSTDEHCQVMQGEKTPASFGEVPGFVLARIRGEDSPIEPCTNTSTSSQNRSRSAARVCLEKRFNTMCADIPKQQDNNSAVPGNFLITVQQSAGTQEAFLHPQMHKWIKTDRTNPFEVSSQFVGDGINTVLNMCEQVTGHIPYMVEPKRPQGLIIPKRLSFNFRPEVIVPTAQYTNGSNSTEEQQLVNRTENGVAAPVALRKHSSTHTLHPNKAASAAPDSAGESGNRNRKRARTQMTIFQRREKHNSKERERRKKIRLYCDELNMLVPFCELETDKVTTLQWTTAFLRYINETYGDTFREEFQKAFDDGKGHFLKSSLSSGQEPIHRDMSDTQIIPLAVEQ